MELLFIVAHTLLKAHKRISHILPPIKKFCFRQQNIFDIKQKVFVSPKGKLLFFYLVGTILYSERSY